MDGKSVSLEVEKLMYEDTEKAIIERETISALEMVEFAYIDLYASLSLYKSQVLNENKERASNADKALKLLEEIKKVID